MNLFFSLLIVFSLICSVVSLRNAQPVEVGPDMDMTIENIVAIHNKYLQLVKEGKIKEAEHLKSATQQRIDGGLKSDPRLGPVERRYMAPELIGVRPEVNAADLSQQVAQGFGSPVAATASKRLETASFAETAAPNLQRSSHKSHSSSDVVLEAGRGPKDSYRSADPRTPKTQARRPGLDDILSKQEQAFKKASTERHAQVVEQISSSPLSPEIKEELTDRSKRVMDLELEALSLQQSQTMGSQSLGENLPPQEREVLLLEIHQAREKTRSQVDKLMSAAKADREYIFKTLYAPPQTNTAGQNDQSLDNLEAPSLPLPM